MVTIAQAIQAVEEDLRARGEEYFYISSPEEVRYAENWLLASPLDSEIRSNVFLVFYRIPWVMDYEEITVQVSAETGKVLARLGPASYSG